MIRADLHTHTTFSDDGAALMEDSISAAADKGLEAICFTDHYDPDYPGGEFALNTPSYLETLMRLRGEYSGRIKVLCGVELGLMKHLGELLREYTEKWDFDFVIGSSHLVDGMDPYYPEYFGGLGSKNGILRYFESILENIGAFYGFDVYGHLDYVVRYSPDKGYDPTDYREMIDAILKKLISMGKGIEINTAGLKSLSHCNPHPFILKRYKELGGEIITVGSDAHDTARIAADFDKAEAALLSAGFRYYTVFEKRKAVMLPLEA